MGTVSDTEYIPRDTVDNVLLALEDRLKNNPFAFTAMAMAIDKIDNIPAADVAPVVHGRWSKEMRFTEDFMGNRTYGYKCSVCGKLANRLPFCGNCGAKMGSEENGNE